MTPRELIDRLLGDSGWGTLAELEAKNWIDCQPDFDTAHYTKGFAWPDGKFRFKPDWKTVPFRSPWLAGPVDDMPVLPDHWEVIEEATPEHPFRLGTSPARNFLNSTFNETPTSLAREQRPTVMIHPEDAAALGIADGDKVVLGNTRGEVRLHAKHFDGVRRGVLIAESIWPNTAYEDGKGINTLTGADAIAPYGGAAFHDNRVWDAESVRPSRSTPHFFPIHLRVNSRFSISSNSVPCFGFHPELARALAAHAAVRAEARDTRRARAPRPLRRSASPWSCRPGRACGRSIASPT